MAQQSPPSVVVLGGINMDLVTMTLRFPEAGETVVGVFQERQGPPFHILGGPQIWETLGLAGVAKALRRAG